MDAGAEVRIDKWLWAARVFKTRGLALAACRAGHVRLKGNVVKPGRAVHVDDVFVVVTPALTRTLRVVGITDRRVGAKLVASLAEDLTPPEAREQARQSAAQQILSRPQGTGRPTKRERRQMERWMP